MSRSQNSSETGNAGKGSTIRLKSAGRLLFSTSFKFDCLVRKCVLEMLTLSQVVQETAIDSAIHRSVPNSRRDSFLIVCKSRGAETVHFSLLFLDVPVVVCSEPNEGSRK